MLRLPRHMSQEAKLARVDDVAAALGLEGARDTIIGGRPQPPPGPACAERHSRAATGSGPGH